MWTILFLGFINFATAIVDDVTVTAISEVPYIVSVRAEYVHICGGTIVSTMHILTAPPCIGDRNNEEIQYGVLNVSTSTNIIAKESRYVHPQYDPYALIPKYAIAVWKLRSPIPLSGTSIKSINLPLRDANVELPNIALLSGYGSSNLLIGPRTPLRKVYMIVNPSTKCAGLRGFDSENHLCIGKQGELRGPCGRDRGGPIVIDNVLVGLITSYSTLSGGRCGSISGQAKIVPAIDWISSVLIQ